MQVKVYNQSGKEVGTVELPDMVFGLKWNANLMHQVVTSQHANCRRGTAHAKNRSEVRGGGRKPWRQKGTGRARHGSIRSPIWKGGGVTHGPQKEKIYEKKINKKMAGKALHTALSAKARDHQLIVIDELQFESPKTKYAAIMFEKIQQSIPLKALTKGGGILVAIDGEHASVRRNMKNLPYVTVEDARNLNAMLALKYTYILFPERTITQQFFPDERAKAVNKIIEGSPVA